MSLDSHQKDIAFLSDYIVIAYSRTMGVRIPPSAFNQS